MSVFKAYDIRGVVDKDLTIDLVEKIGYAISKFFGGEDVVLGMDVRTHSFRLAEALSRGLLAGGNVVFIGTATTPLVHYASLVLDRPAVMITASHNPPEYNGMKVMRRGGLDLESREIQQLASMLEPPPQERRGVVYTRDVLTGYVEYMAERFGGLDMAVGFDPANAAGVILRPLLERVFKRAVVINGVPDGRFPSHPPDPEKPENLRQLSELVRREGLDAGIALDGDCDRVGLVTARGEVFRAEKIAYMLIEHYAKPGDVVVLDATMPLYLEEVARERGVKAVRERVGHSFQKPTAVKNNALFWAEYSGHVGFKDHHYFDDGIYTALKVLQIARGLGKTLDDLLAEAPKVYEERLDLRVDDQRRAMERARAAVRAMEGVEIYEIDGVDVRFRDGGRILVRPSNTEPLIRVKLEAREPSQLAQLKGQLGSLGLA
ncbi:MAG: phosphomannomutase/phosphoglucomutase [Thermoproteus sp.]